MGRNTPNAHFRFLFFKRVVQSSGLLPLVRVHWLTVGKKLRVSGTCVPGCHCRKLHARRMPPPPTSWRSYHRDCAGVKIPAWWYKTGSLHPGRWRRGAEKASGPPFFSKRLKQLQTNVRWQNWKTLVQIVTRDRKSEKPRSLSTTYLCMELPYWSYLNNPGVTRH